MNIRDSIVLVTGANRGLGRALVDALLAAGARRVYAGARDPSRLDAAVAADPTRVVPLKLDVTDGAAVAAAAERLHDLDLLVNNAGVLASYDVLTASRADLDRDFATNVFGALALTRALLPAIERSPRGAIANVLSVVSLASMPSLGGYGASKAAALSMTQALRGALRAKKIAVHAVFPGPVDTDMVRAFDMPKASPRAVADAIVEGIARGDEDIAPDATSRDVYATWQRDPKALERRLAAM